MPDVLIAWVAGVLAGPFLAGPLYDSSKSLADQSIWFLIAVVVLQTLGWFAALLVVSRVKGQSSLRRDFGLDLDPDPAHVAVFARWLAAGLGLALVGFVVMLPIEAIGDFGDEVQDVARALDRASGIGQVLFALTVVIVTPVGEELIFRGGVQRALQRRFRAEIAVFGTALLFAVSHVAGDPDSYPAVPSLLLLGVVSGYQAYRTGDLTRSIALHCGFNLLATLELLR